MSGGIIKDDIGIPCEVMNRGSYLTHLKRKDVKKYIIKLFSSNNQELNIISLNEFKIFIKELH